MSEENTQRVRESDAPLTAAVHQRDVSKEAAVPTDTPMLSGPHRQGVPKMGGPAEQVGRTFKA